MPQNQMIKKNPAYMNNFSNRLWKSVKKIPHMRLLNHHYLRGSDATPGKNMIRSYIRGGNGFIRSSIACHLICIILLNRRSFHKKCPLTKVDNISGLRIPQNWLLHFHRKFNLAIPSRFPGSRIITSSLLLMRKHNGL